MTIFPRCRKCRPEGFLGDPARFTVSYPALYFHFLPTEALVSRRYHLLPLLQPGLRLQQQQLHHYQLRFPELVIFDDALIPSYRCSTIRPPTFHQYSQLLFDNTIQQCRAVSVFLPWALLARARRKLRVLRLVPGHGGSVDMSLGRLVRVHAERGVFSAVDAGLLAQSPAGKSNHGEDSSAVQQCSTDNIDESIFGWHNVSAND